MLNPDSSVYSATVNADNVRDQVTSTREYPGPATGSVFQESTAQYDGFGRPWKKHLPQFDANTFTVLTYNADDSVHVVTDPRGATTTYAYNHRKLVTSKTYSAPSGIPVPGVESFAYDAAANKLTMSDDTGTLTYGYDQLSHLTSETRTFAELSGTFTLDYDHNLAEC